MKIIGLTGSMGMGKTTICRQFKRLGVPVHNADEAIHALYAPHGRAVEGVARLFPEAYKADTHSIDRAKLASLVFGNSEALDKLKSLVYPLLRDETDRWIKKQRRMGKKVVVLEVPLLFEERLGHNLREKYDLIAVVSAPSFLQKQRVLKRGGVTEAEFYQRLKLQLSDAKKRQKADHIILSGLGLYASMAYLKKTKELRQGRGSAYSPKWKT